MKKPNVLSLGAALLWLLLVVAVYYWVHKPITPALVRALGGALLDFGSAVLVFAVAGGVGRALLLPTLPTWGALSRPEKLAGEALLGSGAVSLALLVVGALRLDALAVLLTLLALALSSWRGLLGWLGDLWAWRRIAVATTERFLAVFIGLNLFLALAMALTPPTKFDTLTYHLVGAKHWLAAGHWVTLDSNHFFGFPQLVNTLFAGQMALLDGRLTGAASLHWLYGVFFLLMVGGYAARRFSLGVGIWAAALLLSATSVWLALGWAYVDLAAAGFGMVAFIALEQWQETRAWRWLALGAVFVGLALGVKYTAVIFALAAGAYVLVYARRDLLKAGALFGGVALLVFLPWMLRGGVLYDNPLYPYGAPSGEWDALTDTWYTNIERAPLRKFTALTAPILLTPTFIGIEGAEIFGATIGPLFLLLIPLLLLTWRRFSPSQRSSLGGMLGMVLLMHALWLVMAYISIHGAQTRLLYPMFGLLAVLAAAALDSLRTLPKKPIYLAWLVRTVVLLVLALTLLDHLAGTRPKEGQKGLQSTTLESHFLETRALEYLLGIIDQDAYLEQALGWHITTIQMLNRLPDDARILFLWETRSLYCDEPRISCVEDAILHRFWHDRRVYGDEGLLAAWSGYTHILVWETGRQHEFENNPLLTADDRAAWGTFVEQLPVQWRGADVYTLYRIE